MGNYQKMSRVNRSFQRSTSLSEGCIFFGSPIIRTIRGHACVIVRRLNAIDQSLKRGFLLQSVGMLLHGSEALLCILEMGLTERKLDVGFSINSI